MVSQAEQCSFQIGNFKPFAMLGGINTSCSLTLSKVCIAFTNSAISVFVPCSSKQPNLFPKSTHPAASNRKGMFWNYEKGTFLEERWIWRKGNRIRSLSGGKKQSDRILNLPVTNWTEQKKGWLWHFLGWLRRLFVSFCLINPHKQN